jgi:hypothetical protein
MGAVGSMSIPKNVVLGMSQAMKFPMKTARPPTHGPRSIPIAGIRRTVGSILPDANPMTGIPGSLDRTT